MWGGGVRLEVGRPARGSCNGPSLMHNGKRNRLMIYLKDENNEVNFKEANPGLPLQVFRLPHRRECCSRHRQCLISKSCVICLTSSVGIVCLLQLWQMVVKSLVTEFVYFDSFLLE